MGLPASLSTISMKPCRFARWATAACSSVYTQQLDRPWPAVRAARLGRRHHSHDLAGRFTARRMAETAATSMFMKPWHSQNAGCSYACNRRAGTSALRARVCFGSMWQAVLLPAARVAHRHGSLEKAQYLPVKHTGDGSKTRVHRRRPEQFPEAGIARQQHGGVAVRHMQQTLVRIRIGQTVAGQARLAGAERIAAATQAEVLVGYDEAVFGVAQQGQAAAGCLVDPVLVQQQAEAGVAPRPTRPRNW